MLNFINSNLLILLYKDKIVKNSYLKLISLKKKNLFTFNNIRKKIFYYYFKLFISLRIKLSYPKKYFYLTNY